MSKWIRKGDLVKALSGNDKGKIGEVLQRDGAFVLVQGINIRKKHLRRTQESQGPRIVEMEVPLHVSNLVLCDKEGHPFKLRVSQKGGSKSLITKKGGTEYRTLRKRVK